MRLMTHPAVLRNNLPNKRSRNHQRQHQRTTTGLVIPQNDLELPLRTMILLSTPPTSSIHRAHPELAIHHLTKMSNVWRPSEKIPTGLAQVPTDRKRVG